MILTILLIVAVAAVIAVLFSAKAKGTDSNGPMNNN
jgi:hypothetical protein